MVDEWVCKTFVDWHFDKGYGVSVTIEDPSKQPNLHNFMDMLSEFILKVSK